MVLIGWFIITGAFAGLCAVLFGIGGGMIFNACGFSPDIIAHLAVGTSLATKEQLGKPLSSAPIKVGIGGGIGVVSAIFGIGRGS